MVELGQLEKQHAEFEKRKTQIYVVSNDNLELSQKTQALFKYLIVVADPNDSMIDAMQVMHHNAAPGKDAAAPTTFLFTNGVVQWMFRPDRITDRQSPEQLLRAIDHRPSFDGRTKLPDQ